MAAALRSATYESAVGFNLRLSRALDSLLSQKGRDSVIVGTEATLACTFIQPEDVLEKKGLIVKGEFESEFLILLSFPSLHN